MASLELLLKPITILLILTILGLVSVKILDAYSTELCKNNFKGTLQELENKACFLDFEPEEKTLDLGGCVEYMYVESEERHIKFLDEDDEDVTEVKGCGQGGVIQYLGFSPNPLIVFIDNQQQYKIMVQPGGIILNPCLGQVTLCRDIGDRNRCGNSQDEGQIGCWWVPSADISCKGTAEPCEKFSDEASCGSTPSEGQLGCYWAGSYLPTTTSTVATSTTTIESTTSTTTTTSTTISGTTTTIGPPVCNQPGLVTTENTNFILNGGEFKFVGVNAYYLGFPEMSDSDIENTLMYLTNDCGVSVVRFWGFPGRIGINNVERVLKIGKKYNLKFIVVLENARGEETYTGQKTTEWYRDGYKTDYKTYVTNVVSGLKIKYRNEILAWELLNEPHCGYDTTATPDCPDVLFDFMKDMSSYIKQLDPDHMVSTGVIARDQPGVNPFDDSYRNIHDLWSIEVATAHMYTEDSCRSQRPEECMMTDLNIANDLNKPFFIGEIGMAVDDPVGCVNRCDVNCQNNRINQISPIVANILNNGGDGVLIWQYSNEGRPWCDRWSFFRGDVMCGYLKSVSESLC